MLNSISPCNWEILTFPLNKSGGVLGLQEGCKRLDLLFLLEMLLEVKDAIKKTRLSPHGQRPVVCIDEAQVTWQTKHNSMCRLD